MNPKTAVLVIHGVGDTRPGFTVDRLLASLSEEDRVRQAPAQELLWMPEQPNKDHSWTNPDPALDKQAPTLEYGSKYATFHKGFPVHIRRGKTQSNHELVFAELYWADLSTFGTTILHSLLGIFQLVFDLRYISDQAADQTELHYRVSRPCLFAASTVLVATVAPLTALLALLLLLHVIVIHIGPEFATISELGSFLTAMLGAVAIGFAVYWFRESKGYSQPRRAFWVGVGVFAGLLILIAVLEQTAFRLIWDPFRWLHNCTFPNNPVREGTLLWFTILVLNIIRGIGNIQVLLITIPIFLYLFALTYELFRNKEFESHQPLGAACCAAILQLGLWSTITGCIFFLAAQQGFASAATKDIRLLTSGWGFLAINLTLGTIVASVAWTTWVVGKMRATSPAPRLLIGGWIQAVLFVTWFAAMFFGLYAAYYNLLRHGLIPWFEQYETLLAAVLGAVLGVAVLLLRPGLAAGLHILTDVTNHFGHCETSIANVFNLYNETNNFERRRRIENRCKQVLAYLVEESKCSTLVVIAHSQGTIIAIDVINDEKVALPNTLSLITMGSPFTHLYQKYFPTQYPRLGPLPVRQILPERASVLRFLPFWQTWSKGWKVRSASVAEKEHWRGLKRVQRWVNLYRSDDFVGTSIAFPPIEQRDGSTWDFDDKSVRIGAHTNYWSQVQVIKEIASEIEAAITRANSNSQVHPLPETAERIESAIGRTDSDLQWELV